MILLKTPRRRRAALVLAVATMLSACASTKLTLDHHRLHPDLQAAYGNVYVAVRELDAVQTRLGTSVGRICRFNGPVVQCVDGGIMINGAQPTEVELNSARRGASAFLATTGTVVQCTVDSYCPENAAEAFKTPRCIKRACPIDPESNSKGCFYSTCEQRVVDSPSGN
jgi:hypothetical protein